MDFGIITQDIESSGLHSFVEEIYMCIETLPYEAVHDLSAGQANGQRFIGMTSITAEEAVHTLREDIQENTLGAQKYEFEIDVKFARGTIRDIIVIDIVVYDSDGNSLTSTYNIR